MSQLMSFESVNRVKERLSGEKLRWGSSIGVVGHLKVATRLRVAASRTSIDFHVLAAMNLLHGDHTILGFDRPR